MTARWPLVLNGTTIQELQTGDTLNGVSSFDAGTAMLFVQTSAPTGWTKSTTHNDKALRVVSGAASSGGSVGFTTAFASGNTGATTLSISQMPSHTHAAYSAGSAYGGATATNWANAGARAVAAYPYDYDSLYVTNLAGSGAQGLQSTGGGGSHTHSLSLAVAYVDVIIATKN